MGEPEWCRISILSLSLAEIYRSPIDPRWRSRLKPFDCKPISAQSFGDLTCGRIASSARRHRYGQTLVDTAAKKGPCGHDDCPGGDHAAFHCLDTIHSPARQQQSSYRSLAQIQ
jgi:hypothetical protein